MTDKKGARRHADHRCTRAESCEGRDEEFVVHDIKVIEGEKGLFIEMPSKKALDGEYRDIAHPINSATRERIQSIILEKYEEALSQEAEAEPEMA